MLEKIKKMEDMNQKELMDLVCYVGINQSTLYYSKISSINEKKLKMVYDGNQYDISPESVKLIINGKNIYELYKLMNTQEDFSKKVKEETEEILKSKFNFIIQDLLNNINENKHKLFDELQEEKNVLFGELNEVKSNSKTFIDLLKDDLRKMKYTNERLERFLKDVDFAKMEEDIKSGISKIKPLQDEFNSVVKDLKKLFK